VTIALQGVRAVVLDIEGTVGSGSHVRDVLFPYARERYADWFAARRGQELWTDALTSVRADAGRPDLDEAGAVAALVSWTDGDVKVAALKTLQGEIWAEGYGSGALQGHVYDDVPDALARWRSAGLDCHIYSSGSVTAQRYWFGYSDHGDLTGLLCRYFDLTTAGPKAEPASYQAISKALDVAPWRTLFLSDTEAELRAASTAGWQTVAVRRPDDPRPRTVGGHRVIADLTELDLS
jgi:enolase-phosphatase E1